MSTRGTLSTQDVTKLPKWAQQRLELAEMRLKEKQADLDKAQDLLGWSEGEYGQIFVPDRDGRTDPVIFGATSLDPLGVFEVTMKPAPVGDELLLEIRTSNSQLGIEPRSSNSVWAKVID